MTLPDLLDVVNRAGLVIDGHLDLAYNAGVGRDLTLPLDELRSREGPGARDIATVTFGALRAGRVAVCLGTLFAMPRTESSPHGYTDADGAHAQALAQLDQYRRWEDAGHVRLLRPGAEVAAHLRESARDPDATPLGVVLLMEGADPIRTPDELPFWVQQGVQIVGLSWRGTRYAGGTGVPGGLSAVGEELLDAMREQHVTLDASHLAEQSFWEALERQPDVIASHSNARARVPTDRHLTDDMLRAIGDGGGVVGTVLYNGFLHPGWARGEARTPPQTVAAMLDHLAEVAGWAHVGLGSDMDGGFGLREFPEGLNSAADLGRVADLVPADHRAGVRAGNWARWLTLDRP
ncbi:MULTISPECIES: dipeptidase [Deinococcus]|uniref:Dipeptidase n=1 Tax=Deinococcus rufus TaxID=2136097 RepID=A0ABV7Z550_9DEIO|nr:membrane dipeptidase [Deinococcus sp. AB2017081]WQE96320.1 membrane dipeptidase [Deinococcus sp. AB2017081]